MAKLDYVKLFALAAGILSFLTTVRGPGLSPDSVEYLSTGINLSSGRGLTTLGGETLTVFPPGVPTIAAIAQSIGFPPQQALRLLSAASAIATVVLGHTLLRRLPVRSTVIAVFTGLIAFSPALHAVTKMAWSEPPFLVVSLLMLVILGAVWDDERITTRQWGTLVLLGWIAFLLRYAGIALIASTALILLLALRPRSLRNAIPAVGFAVLSMATPVLWMLRNYSVDGTLMGPRSASNDSIVVVLARIGFTIGTWFIPIGGWSIFPRFIVSLVGALLVIVVALAIFRSFTRRASSPAEKAVLASGIGPSLLSCSVYCGYLVAAQLSAAFDTIDNRLLSPVFVPCAILAALALNEALNFAGGRRLVVLHPIANVILAGLFVLSQAAPTVNQVRAGASEGIGLNSSRVRESELAAKVLLTVQVEQRTLYTNAATRLWVATGLQEIKNAPRFAGIRGIEVTGALNDFVDAISCDSPALLAWYEHGDVRSFSIDELRQVVILEHLDRTADGVLYKIRPSDPFDADC